MMFNSGENRVSCILVSLWIVSFSGISYGSDCEDMAETDFCKSIAHDCHNPAFKQFYRDQCRETCGFCGQRFLSNPDQDRCDPMPKVRDADITCDNDEGWFGSACTVTCHSNFKLRALSKTDSGLPLESDKSVQRVCWCFGGRCDWLGGAAFLYCEKQELDMDSCEEKEVTDHSKTVCSNGNNHGSSCTTRCDNGYGLMPENQSPRPGASYPAFTKRLCICSRGSCRWYGRTGYHCVETAARPTWSEWSAWSSCSASCGRGSRTKTRTCGSGECGGPSEVIESCLADKHCECSCQGNCKNQKSSYYCALQKRRCTKSSYIRRICASSCGTCPKCECGTWGEWKPSGQCSEDCGTGTQKYVRTCPLLKTCSGDSEDSQRKNREDKCMGSCSSDCGSLPLDPNASAVCQRSQVGQICTSACNEGYHSTFAKSETQQTCACSRGKCGWAGIPMKCAQGEKTTTKASSKSPTAKSR